MTLPDPDDGSGQPEDGPSRRTVAYPGGLTAHYRWVGSGGRATLDALDGREAAARGAEPATDLATLVAEGGERMCAAELRLEGPNGAWTVRLASSIHDDPQGVFWDTARLLLVKYGFAIYALVARTGELLWHHTTRTPMLTLLGSTRLPHVIAQSELETFALGQDGEVAWRIAHSDVVIDARLVGGRLILALYGGSVLGLDPRTGSLL
ncbi:MAG: PQQ-binding-like beta-propeller repeat protein [Chloroflexi bacterium]|nr:PQQ-binding-like beta-propeller repeat protein [Chloroflexota bacterium]